MGAPTLYRPEYAIIAKNLSLLLGPNATNAKLANLLRIGESTLSTWIRKHPDLKAAIQEGRELADSQVAAALYQRATGTVVRERKVETATINGELVERETITEKELPPSERAAEFWLRNRQRAYWPDKQDIDVHAPMIEVRDFSRPDRPDTLDTEVGSGEPKQLPPGGEGH